jgi:drug/metabolite transporter (DMT)-like permease
MHNNKVLRASLFVVISAILYGFLGYIGTSVLDDGMTISTMLFWRFITAAAWILLFIVWRQCRQTAVEYPSKKNFFKMFMLGAVGYTGTSGFYFLSSQYVGTGLAMVIFFSYPIIVAITPCIRHRRKLNGGIAITLIVMTTGLFMIRNSSSTEMNFLGIFYGIVNAICYAFYVMGSKRLSSAKMDSNIFTFMVCMGSAVIFLMLSLATHSFVFPATLKSFTYVLALGVLTTALPIQLMLEGLKYVSSLRASIISVLEPLVTLLVGILILQESITSIQLFGAILIMGSTLLVQFNKEL